jgi:hypothetical protein
MILIKQKNTPLRRSYDSILIMFFVLLSIASLNSLVNYKSQSDYVDQFSSLATISRTYHEVRFRRNADFRWRNAKYGQQLNIRDRIFTGSESQADIEVKNNKIRIKEKSLVEIGPSKDYDLKLEFGFLIINMNSDSLRILIKGKKYLIKPKEAMELSIKLAGKDLEFIGDQDKVSITETTETKQIEVIEKGLFNQEVCNINTRISQIDLSLLCPGCSETNQLILESEAGQKQKVKPGKPLELERGKNIFHIENKNEVCEIILSPISAPDINLIDSKVKLDFETDKAELGILVIENDSNFVSSYFKLEISENEKFGQSRVIKFDSNTVKFSLNREGQYFFRVSSCNEKECSEESAPILFNLVRSENLSPPKLNDLYKVIVP